MAEKPPTYGNCQVAHALFFEALRALAALILISASPEYCVSYVNCGYIAAQLNT